MNQTLSSLLARWRGQPTLVRELLWLVVAVIAGLLLMPPLIWLLGRATLGGYANGGPMALWIDFLRGLGHGELPFWVVLAGPYVFMSLSRAGALLWRKSSVM